MILLVAIIIIIVRSFERNKKIKIVRALHKLGPFFIILIPYPKRNLYSIILSVGM
jgi:hypothetical protein